MERVPSSIQQVSHATSLRETVEMSLSTAIASGELKQGALVTVPTLAAQFGVSATPVREAMLNLEKRGFVRSVRNKGFLVTDVSEQDLVDLVQIRRWLEAPAMRIVAERLRGKPVQEYRELASEISDAAGRSDFYHYLTADAEFHLALLKLVGNNRLIDLVRELRGQTRLVGLASLSNTVELQSSSSEHHTLIDLLVDGRGIDAENLMIVHIGHVIGWWAGRRED